MQRITPYVDYEDVPAAIAWLTRAFGFAEVLRWTDQDGRVAHAEITLGEDANVMLGNPGEDFREPITPNPYFVLSCQVDDLDAHFARAKAAGARIEREPTDEPYGMRMYRCFDPYGHAWWFSTPTHEVAPEQWGAVRAATP